ncbi:DinB family protein [Cytobacillus solani]|uniref:DinB family protein n=1 Tax=Cytobacillus solani TaxID=1637975 RepID=UPI0015EEF568|nr:DinB family protein [Cytobacillus solani]USK54767.1 DinB family protein [Cytobacillus solani]
MQLEKQNILLHYEQSIQWVKGLEQLSEEQWRTPIKEGKWSVAEIIGHLIPWDMFIIKDRMPYFFKDIDLPKGPDAQALNDQAASESRVRTKEETIERFAATRKTLLSALQEMNDDLWSKELIIGKSTLSLAAYFQGMVEHDNHHFEQIKNVI